MSFSKLTCSLIVAVYYWETDLYKQTLLVSESPYVCVYIV